MSILALDPTLGKMGYCLFDENLFPIDLGVWKTERSKDKKTRVSDDDSVRTMQMARYLAEYALKNNAKGIMAERPSGSMTASALKSFSIGNAIIDCVSALLNIPVEFCTPSQTKLGVTDKKTASKKDIMNAVCEIYSWKVEKKSVNSKRGVRIDQVYFPLGRKMAAGTFEHIADAIAVFHYLKPSSQIIKFYSKNALVA